MPKYKIDDPKKAEFLKSLIKTAPDGSGRTYMDTSLLYIVNFKNNSTGQDATKEELLQMNDAESYKNFGLHYESVNDFNLKNKLNDKIVLSDKNKPLPNGWNMISDDEIKSAKENKEKFVYFDTNLDPELVDSLYDAAKEGKLYLADKNSKLSQADKTKQVTLDENGTAKTVSLADMAQKIQNDPNYEPSDNEKMFGVTMNALGSQEINEDKDKEPDNPEDDELNAPDEPFEPVKPKPPLIPGNWFIFLLKRLANQFVNMFPEVEQYSRSLEQYENETKKYEHDHAIWEKEHKKWEKANREFKKELKEKKETYERNLTPQQRDAERMIAKIEKDTGTKLTDTQKDNIHRLTENADKARKSLDKKCKKAKSGTEFNAKDEMQALVAYQDFKKSVYSNGMTNEYGNLKFDGVELGDKDFTKKLSENVGEKYSDVIDFNKKQDKAFYNRMFVSEYGLEKFVNELDQSKKDFNAKHDAMYNKQHPEETEKTDEIQSPVLEKEKTLEGDTETIPEENVNEQNKPNTEENVNEQNSEQVNNEQPEVEQQENVEEENPPENGIQQDGDELDAENDEVMSPDEMNGIQAQNNELSEIFAGNENGFVTGSINGDNEIIVPENADINEEIHQNEIENQGDVNPDLNLEEQKIEPLNKNEQMAQEIQTDVVVDKKEDDVEKEEPEKENIEPLNKKNEKKKDDKEQVKKEENEEEIKKEENKEEVKKEDDKEELKNEPEEEYVPSKEPDDADKFITDIEHKQGSKLPDKMKANIKEVFSIAAKEEKNLAEACKYEQEAFKCSGVKDIFTRELLVNYFNSAFKDGGKLSDGDIQTMCNPNMKNEIREFVDLSERTKYFSERPHEPSFFENNIINKDVLSNVVKEVSAESSNAYNKMLENDKLEKQKILEQQKIKEKEKEKEKEKKNLQNDYYHGLF